MAAKNRTKKRLTKRERKAQRNAERPAHAHGEGAPHIHCVACGAHLDPAQFLARPSTARWLRCQHGSRFACCVGCVAAAQRRLDDHDRSGRPVAAAAAWH